MTPWTSRMDASLAHGAARVADGAWKSGSMVSPARRGAAVRRIRWIPDLVGRLERSTGAVIPLLERLGDTRCSTFEPACLRRSRRGECSLACRKMSRARTRRLTRLHRRHSERSARRTRRLRRRFNNPGKHGATDPYGQGRRENRHEPGNHHLRRRFRRRRAVATAGLATSLAWLSWWQWRLKMPLPSARAAL
jgi:hypothetical protein